ncbi:50S ribosomal protein L32e [uncultured archaeon]|nr:50S ribosomal protein L32e [uncultured archaeon]
MTKFLRIGYTQYSKLGLRRKNKQIYRKGKGLDNKMRLKMKGHLRNVSIGFRTEKETRGLVNGLTPVLVYSVEDLKKISKTETAIVAKMGDKKKKEIAEFALKNNIRLTNLNSKKFLTKLEEKMKERKEEKTKKLGKKAEKEKKSKEEKKKEEKPTAEKKLEDSINSEDKKDEPKK